MTDDVSMEHWLNNTTETCASALPRICLFCRSSSHGETQKILTILFSAPQLPLREPGLSNRSDQPPRMKSSRVLSNCNLSPRGRTATRGRWLIASLLCPNSWRCGFTSARLKASSRSDVLVSVFTITALDARWHSSLCFTHF